MSCGQCVIILFGVMCIGASAQEKAVQLKAPVKQEDEFSKLIHRLHHDREKYDAPLRGTRIRTLLETMSARTNYQVRFVLREELFERERGPEADLVADQELKSTLNLTGHTAHDVLRIALSEVNGTYLVRKDHIEIVPLSAVAEFFDDPRPKSDSQAVSAKIRSTPLVSAVFEEMSLKAALADLEARYERTIHISTKAAPAANEIKVSVRLMNVPLPTAVKMLAKNADLDVIEADNMMMVLLHVSKSGTERPDRR